MKKILSTLLLSAFVLNTWGNSPMYTVTVKSNSANESQRENFKLGNPLNPSGNSLLINSQNMVIDGKAVIPVMGEFHYARFPESEWKKELLKMKAGGITIAATYIFWIHHEEVEGKYNWQGDRNLGKFVETCKEVGMPIVLRVGPWCHGEARNGGIPDWMVKSGIKLRSNNPQYLAILQKWFSEIHKQVKGQMWKEGGPIIGIQLENEYRGSGAHLMTLKKMATDIGFDVPLYTRTGWPALTSPIPFGEILPLYGDYPDGFWDRSTKDMPGDYWRSFIFRSFRNSTVIATEQLPKQSDKDNPDDIGYPFLTCELGGGMTPSYHRRIQIAPMDIYSMALVKVGSGSNLPGYYMYHGGTNPKGELTTLNEMQNTPMTFNNDLPVKSYDFQAPLGEFGQINPHYHLLRKMHLFLSDFGDELSAMPPYIPEIKDTDYRNDSSLRWSVRSNGESGYVFVSNYHRLSTLSPKENVQFTINLPKGKVVFPETPITIPSGTSFFMPFNMNLNGTQMVYSTAQPVAKLLTENESIYIFARNKDISPEFVFESKGMKIESCNIKPIEKNGRIYLKGVKTGTNFAISIRETKNNKKVNILLLDEEDALSFWKGELNGNEHLFLSNSNLTYLNNELELTNKSGERFNVSIYPKPSVVSWNNQTLRGKKEGIFTEYSVKPKTLPRINVKLEQIKKEDTDLRELKKGRGGVAEAPSDSDFSKAAEWKVILPQNVEPSRDIFLRFPYTGDVARVYLDGELLTDNFFNGKPFTLGLKRYAPNIYNKEVTIKILPIKNSGLVYIPKETLVDFSKSEYLLNLPTIEIDEKMTINLKIQ